MRYALTVVMLAALLAAACKDSESPTEKTPSHSTPAAMRPEPVAPLPEGVLLVQRESRLPTTFAIAADGSVAEHQQGFIYVPSPDGEHASFMRGASQDRPSEVVIMDGQGRETFAQRGPEPGPDSMYPGVLWSPDGSELAYTLPDEQRPSANRVYLVNADGKERRQVTTDAGSYSLIGWTQDGRLLVRDGAGLTLMGGKTEALPLPEGLPALGDVQMSRGGRFVAFTVGNFDETRQLWLLEVDTGDSRLLAEMGRLARRPAEERYVSAAPPAAPLPDAPAAMLKGPPPLAWSPDGKRIAYYRNGMVESNTLTSELRVVDVETGQDVSVTTESSSAATWSPDGRYLAESGGDQGGVVLLGPGNGVRTLDVQPNYMLWAPDGRLLAVSGGSLSLVDPETGDVEEARTADGKAIVGAQGWGAVWSPDGRHLAVATGEDAGMRNGSLYVIDTQTATAALILEKGSFQPVAWLRS